MNTLFGYDHATHASHAYGEMKVAVCKFIDSFRGMRHRLFKFTNLIIIN